MHGALCQMVAVHIQLSLQGQLVPQFMPVLLGLYVLVCEVEELMLMAFESTESSEKIHLLGPGSHKQEKRHGISTLWIVVLILLVQ